MKPAFSPKHESISCYPLTLTQALVDLPVANRCLGHWQRERLQAGGIDGNAAAESAGLSIHPASWLAPADIVKLAHWQAPQPMVLRSRSGMVLAWGPGPEIAADAHEIIAEPQSLLIRYAWDLLEVNSQLLAALTESRLDGTVSDRVEIDGCVWVGAGSKLLPGVFIEGNVVIGRNCKIGPNCYLRGATAIGDNCHIGQAVEIKNSIIMNGSSIGHLSYCGDSVIGARVNFGAGTITANLRHDGGNHRSLDAASGELVDSGRRKLGCIAGDDVHTGIHTSIYPGRKLWPGTCTLPGAIVDRDVMPAAAAAGAYTC